MAVIETRIDETVDETTGQTTRTERQVDVTAEVNQRTIEDQALAALTANRTYIDRASPTAAQTTAQVKALSRQNNALIRLLLGQLDGTD